MLTYAIVTGIFVMLVHGIDRLARYMWRGFKLAFWGLFYMFKLAFYVALGAIYVLDAVLFWIPPSGFQRTAIKWLRKNGYRNCRAIGPYVMAMDGSGKSWTFYAQRYIMDSSAIPVKELREEMQAQGTVHYGILTRYEHEPIQSVPVIALR